jgi:carbon monoxide dehydrogenase subunit G
MSVQLTARVAVAAPPETVFEAVSDWEAQSEWVALTTVTVEPGGHRVGERLTAVTGLAGLAFSDPMEVTCWEPPRRVVVRHLGRVVRGTGTFTVSPAPGGAWFTWAEDLDLPLGAVGRLGFALVRPAFELMLRRSVARLGRRVERQRSAPGSQDGR